MSYVTRDRLAEYLSRDGSEVHTEAAQDLDEALAVAAGEIDSICNRSFSAPGEEQTVTLHIGTRGGLPRRLIPIPDVVTITEVEDAGETLAEDDWAGISRPADAPTTHLHRTSGSWIGPVKITGEFGWGDTPPVTIQRACLMAAQKYFMRQWSPYGDPGGGGLAAPVPYWDPQFLRILSPYRREGEVAPWTVS